MMIGEYSTRESAVRRIRTDLDYIAAQLGKPEPMELIDYAGAYGRLRGTLISVRSSLGLVADELEEDPEPADYLAVYDLADYEAEHFGYEPDETEPADPDLDAWENEGGRLAS